AHLPQPQQGHVARARRMVSHLQGIRQPGHPHRGPRHHLPPRRPGELTIYETTATFARLPTRSVSRAAPSTGICACRTTSPSIRTAPSLILRSASDEEVASPVAVSSLDTRTRPSASRPRSAALIRTSSSPSTLSLFCWN